MAIQKLKVASKASKSSPDAASFQHKPQNAIPTPFFPFARYTSIVGVHTSLLAFTALILPRSAFADLSSPSAARHKPRQDAIITMTESPARTVAWMCFGCLVLQLWWAGWIREWKLEASIPPLPMAEDGTPIETESQKAERVMRQKEWDSQKTNVSSLRFSRVSAPLTSRVNQRPTALRCWRRLPRLSPCTSSLSYSVHTLRAARSKPTYSHCCWRC
ncbi:hypothetical protein PHLGIDRAFT_246141 [Phlebiopsis gigantea 11061_1 CR5-6]|uniref:Uncharacterized protein n=1 Tax=Phlebiopsis gigantea (strain 11061_1 CR5-6) TaxID=745531 RepID=A0A0C3S536_PHLG1|nr:hypothetical protein PHLGIDRAFT_246141 [Phlebiopsis gigantea 11061_1 CR5-6]